MKRLGILCGLLLFVAAPTTMANITVVDTYFSADAQVYSNLFGVDADHSEGFDPVAAYASVSGQEGAAVAMSSSNYLSLDTLSVVLSGPGHIGAAVGSSGSLLLELTSDTNWILDLESAVSFDFSTNGSTDLTALAILSDLDNNPIYSYDMAVDGLTDSTIFGAGQYNLTLYVSSVALTPEMLNTFEFANSSVELTANVSCIPAPTAALLCLIGTGLVSSLKKRGIV